MNLWIRSFNIIWYYFNTYVCFMKYEFVSDENENEGTHVHENETRKREDINPLFRTWLSGVLV